jgi:hypothetical protein
LLEKARAETVSLKVLGDGEGDLGRLRVTQPRVFGDGDDPLTLGCGDDRDQCAAVVPVEKVLDQRAVDVAGTVETGVQAVLGQVGVKGDESITVLACRRAQPQSCAIAKDDVDEFGS